jgi:L-arabinokinase
VFFALLESGEVPHFGGGVTLTLQSDIPVQAGMASSAAIQVATAGALAALFDVVLDPRATTRICRRANVDVAGAEAGLVDHLACLLGEPDSLLQVRCQPDDVLGTVPLPDDVAIAAVDSGLRLPIYRERYEHNRSASLIGRYLIERVLRHSGTPHDPSGGYLANISPNEYVRRFRNELPVKVRGKEFLAWYGQPETLEVQVEPDQVYKVRSRTEHHIYENDRTHRFMERLARVRRTGERDALVEAGELMYASHWSYGQRCGMGSIETDVLVNLIRERGAGKGLYGAKVTAGGCGGAVAVLMARSGTAADALQEACAVYAEKTGKTPTILTGSSPGATHFHH